MRMNYSQLARYFWDFWKKLIKENKWVMWQTHWDWINQIRNSFECRWTILRSLKLYSQRRWSCHLSNSTPWYYLVTITMRFIDIDFWWIIRPRRDGILTPTQYAPHDSHSVTDQLWLSVCCDSRYNLALLSQLLHCSTCPVTSMLWLSIMCDTCIGDNFPSTIKCSYKQRSRVCLVTFATWHLPLWHFPRPATLMA